MPKICNHPGCNNPVFGGGYCKWHQGYRTDKKKKRVKEKKEYNGLNDLGVKNQVELFDNLWESSSKRSFLSGLPIKIHRESNFWYNIFAHVLSKSQSKYPKFKLYSKNIILLTPYEHFLFDQGTEEMREKYAKEFNCDWNKVYNLREELKEEYRY